MNVKNCNRGMAFNVFTFVSEMDSSISEFGHILSCKLRFQSRINNRMANRVDPDKMGKTVRLMVQKLILIFVPCFLYDIVVVY